MASNLNGQGADRPNRETGLSMKYSNAGNITTLMLRNIPVMYNQDVLLEEIIDCMGAPDNVDFFYLPWDVENDRNQGYAFINFSDAASAERCIRNLTNYRFRTFESRRPCSVVPAYIQGLENNLRHLKDRVVSEAHSHYPIIIWQGNQLKLGRVVAALDEQRRQNLTPSASSAKPSSSTGTEGRSVKSLPRSTEARRSGSSRSTAWPPSQANRKLDQAAFDLGATLHGVGTEESGDVGLTRTPSASFVRHPDDFWVRRPPGLDGRSRGSREGDRPNLGSSTLAHDILAAKPSLRDALAGRSTPDVGGFRSSLLYIDSQAVAASASRAVQAPSPPAPRLLGLDWAGATAASAPASSTRAAGDERGPGLAVAHGSLAGDAGTTDGAAPPLGRGVVSASAWASAMATVAAAMDRERARAVPDHEAGTGSRWIGWRNPDHDVLSKFFKKYDLEWR